MQNAGEPRREIERPPGRRAAVERDGASVHRRRAGAAHDHAALGDLDERGRGRSELRALGVDAASTYQHRVGFLGEGREFRIGIAFAQHDVGVQPRAAHALGGAPQQRRARLNLLGALCDVAEDERRFEPLAQQDRNLVGAEQVPECGCREHPDKPDNHPDQ